MYHENTIKICCIQDKRPLIILNDILILGNKKMSEKYYVVIMDVIGSSRLRNRDEVTDKLGKALKSVNTSYEEDFFAPFEITKGDEVAAVLTAIENTYDMVTIFRQILYPVDIRTILIYDELNAGLNSRHSSIIDGPAFHRGNDMMIKLKKTQKTFSLDTGQIVLNKELEALINLLLWQWNNFSPLQQKIIRLYQETKSQKKVADRIKRKQQQIHSTLDTCRWELIDEAEKVIRKLLMKIDNQYKAKVL